MDKFYKETDNRACTCYICHRIIKKNEIRFRKYPVDDNNSALTVSLKKRYNRKHYKYDIKYWSKQYCNTCKAIMILKESL